ncbi:hypothetical protein [Halorussus sp. MSC15.2]|uniref:hypothetical protein n=1 Tax=Halorussus sp. MSC15.2 TaxID=2283638 RepID=UPI0013CF853D|nr:hypothetical protein [Halorussus sp. MSC15.2]NEU57490.1 hypothetical protein [Halorussus sp. MSC15.2]
MSEQTQDDATDSTTGRRTLLQLAALAGLPLAASDLGRAATSGHLGETWTGSENLDIDVSGSNQGAINLSSEEGFALKSTLTSATDSTGTAIYGNTASDSGKAVWAEATNDSGDAMGVYGTSWSPNGYGVYGDDGGAGGYGVYSEGDMHVEGDFTASGTKNFVQTVETADGEKQVAYTAVEADRAQTETTGVAELEDGRAEIDLPEHFGMVTSTRRTSSSNSRPTKSTSRDSRLRSERPTTSSWNRETVPASSSSPTPFAESARATRTLRSSATPSDRPTDRK